MEGLVMDSRDIFVLYGNSPKEMIKEILTEAGIEEEIYPDDMIGIKPNLVVAKKSSLGATTDPELAAGVIEYLQSKGYYNLAILESPGIGYRTERVFEVCGYLELAEKYSIPLIDLQKDSYSTVRVEGLDIKICNKALEIDYLVNMPVLKGHCQTTITCALKNLKGCIPDSEKRNFHTQGLHKPIACLNKALKQDLVIVDGIMGDLDFEEGGNPVQMDRIIMGKDPVLVDSYAAEVMGHRIEDIPYIKMAEELGIGSADLSGATIRELNNGRGNRVKKSPRKVERLVRNVKESNACSVCYGNLVHALKRLDEQGKLGMLREELYIGQGYKDKEIEGIGIGVCTRGAGLNVPGCPPEAKEIVKILSSCIKS